MAWRAGRKGAWLATDDYTGFTEYASELKRDYWGAYAKKPLLRNLQEVASPLSDPYPVAFYRSSNYETSTPCLAEVAPTYVGNTNVPTSQNNAAFQALDLSPAIPNMEIGCDFIIR